MGKWNSKKQNHRQEGTAVFSALLTWHVQFPLPVLSTIRSYLASAYTPFRSASTTFVGTSWITHIVPPEVASHISYSYPHCRLLSPRKSEWNSKVSLNQILQSLAQYNFFSIILLHILNKFTCLSKLIDLFTRKKLELHKMDLLFWLLF